MQKEGRRDEFNDKCMLPIMHTITQQEEKQKEKKANNYQ